MARQPEHLADQQRALGRHLAALREAAGLYQTDIARAVPCHRTTVTHAEAGSQLPASDFWETADRLVGANGALINRYDELIQAKTAHLTQQQAKRRARAHATAQQLTAASLTRPGAALMPANPEERERVALVARSPRRVDAATVCALADVLAATRRLEDQIGSAAVLPGIRNYCALAQSLLTDARGPLRDRVGVLVGELHQYLGWLLAETGHTEQARAQLDAALALGVEIDDPDLTSLALSFKGHLAWMSDNPREVIALSRAARRDKRVFIAQHAYNTHQEARGWAMVGDSTAVARTLGCAEELTERALARQADAPPSLYWYGSGFFTLQRGLTWHTLGDARFAGRAAQELITGLQELPAAERDSEWAAIFTVAAAEALTTAGEAEHAITQARQALVVCRATRSTRLAQALRRAHTQMQQTWFTHAAVRELGDEIHLTPKDDRVR